MLDCGQSLWKSSTWFTWCRTYTIRLHFSIQLLLGEHAHGHGHFFQPKTSDTYDSHERVFQFCDI